MAFLSSVYPSGELWNLRVVLETLELEGSVKSEGALGNCCTMLAPPLLGTRRRK